MDYGYKIIEKAAASLGKGELAIKNTDEEYSRIMNGHDKKTQSSCTFQQITAYAAIETHLKPQVFGV